jgi:hypothetical protein
LRYSDEVLRAVGCALSLSGASFSLYATSGVAVSLGAKQPGM